jgi:hypothetical protein
MTQRLDFFIKSKNYEAINLLIRECNVRDYFHFQSSSGYTFFQVAGSNKHMAKFHYMSEPLREKSQR